jgi:uncharacterized protein
MTITLRQLDLGKVTFQERFTLAQLGLGEPGLTLPEGVALTGEAELANSFTEEIRVRGRSEGTAYASCDRCLESMPIDLSAEFKLLYEPASAEAAGEEEVELSEKDVEVGYYEGDGLDLANLAREQVVLALPMHKLCRPDCKGICPQCGANRNDMDCDCQAPQMDERWTALKTLQAELKPGHGPN